MSVEPAAAPMEWIDVQGRRWRLELPPERIVLHSESDVIDVPAARWPGDVYVASHDRGFIVRFEHFDSPLGFFVTREQALPLLAHLGAPMQSGPRIEEPTAPPLIWPKVSPLAVWALICSSLVFVPVLGLVPAVVTIVLLIFHRTRVRRSAAYAHSRRLCAAAFAFLALGMLVSALATYGIWQHGGHIEGTSILAKSDASRNIAAIVYGLFVVLLSLTVHEAAHAITAWWLGDGFAKSLGRVTLNPLAHIDPFGTVLLPALLAWAQQPIFGYARPVPVRVENLTRWRRAHILIALAGPGSNLLLASASLLLLLGLACAVLALSDGAHIANFASLDMSAPVVVTGIPLAIVVGPVFMVLKLSFLVNVALALFNLIPLPPLDGSWVLEHLFPGSLGRLYAVIRPFGILVFFAAWYSNLFDYLIYPLIAVVLPGLWLMSAATGM